jgi:hypothetical protein
LNGLGNVFGLNHIGEFEVGDSSSDFEDTVIGTGRQPQAIHGRIQEAPRLTLHLAVFPDLPRAHMRVTVDLAPAKALLLDLARVPHALADGGRWLAGRLSGQVPVSQRGDVDMDVNPIQQGSGDPGEIALDLERRAGALLGGVRGVAARARVHRGGQHEAGRVGQG